MSAAKPLDKARQRVTTALETGEGGRGLDAAVQTLVQAGELPWLAAQLRNAHPTPTAHVVWERLATPNVIRDVAATPRLDVELLDALVERAGLAAVDPLLDVLIASDSAFARRLLLTRIAALGDRVGPLVLRRMPDQPWFVQRNMLGILSELRTLPHGFDPIPYAEHHDARVRREALRILLRQAATRAGALVAALRDADERNLRVGLQAACQGCPEEVVALVAAHATRGATLEVRTLAIRALATTRHPKALDALLTVAAPKWWFFGRRLPPKSDAYLEALRALLGFADDARVQRILTAAERAADPDIARAAAGDGAG